MVPGLEPERLREREAELAHTLNQLHARPLPQCCGEATGGVSPRSEGPFWELRGWAMRGRVPRAVITGVQAIIFPRDAEGVRAFCRNILGLSSVDAGSGWLIFAFTPAELAAHPADEDARPELYLMCDDVEATVEELKGKGVEFTKEVSDEGFGLMTALRLPGGGDLAVDEPKHPSPLSPSG